MSKSDVKYFASPAGRIAYTDTAGAGRPIIFMHGLPTSKELWSTVLPALGPAARLITYDLNGYGQSERIGRAITHRERAEVLDALSTFLGLGEFDLVAHDLGASVALDYLGMRAARVRRLVLLSPPVYPDFQPPLIIKLTRLPGLGEILVWTWRDQLFHIGIRHGLVRKDHYTPAIHRAMAGPFTGAAGRAALLRLLRWGEPRLVFRGYPATMRALRIPTLILHGRRDPYIPLAHAQRLARDISGARLVIIEDGSHFLPLDAPAQVADTIQRFLDGADLSR